MVRPIVNRLPNSEAVAEKVAADLFAFVRSSLDQKSRVDIALTGGKVGIASLAAASALPFSELDLSRLHIWWGDERYVESDSAERNSVQARNAWLRMIADTGINVHEFPSSDSGLPVASAAATFNAEFTSTGIHFDLMLMGMGPDGHVASLFPGKDNWSSSQAIISEELSPKPPPQRLSFSYAEINRSAEIWFTVAGSDKAEAVAVAFGDDPESLPVGRVRGKEKTVWYVDQTAGNLVWGC
jgi:6-phosphogluconolactonase